MYKELTVEEVTKNLEERNLLEVARRIAAADNVPLAALLGRSRRKSIALARRQLYVELHYRGLSYPEIGDVLGRHHVTVLHTVRATKTRSAPEPLRFRIAS